MAGSSDLTLALLGANAQNSGVDPVMAGMMPRLQLGQQMVQSGLDSSPTSKWGGLSRLVQAIAGNYIVDKANTGIQDYYKGATNDFNTQLSNVMRPPDTAPAAAPNPATPPQTGGNDYAGAINGHEGTGQNPRSSAVGTGQFLNGTWNQFAQENPQHFQGMSPDQILAARSDSKLGGIATNWLAAKNGPILASTGVQPTGQALGIAHYLGPQGAAAVMKAPDSAMVSDVLSQQLGAETAKSYIAANPELGNMPVSALRGRYANTPTPGSTPSDTSPSPAPSPQSAAAVDPMAHVRELQNIALAAARSPIPSIKSQAPLLMSMASQALEHQKYNEVAPGRFQGVTGPPVFTPTQRTTYGPAGETNTTKLGGGLDTIPPNIPGMAAKAAATGVPHVTYGPGGETNVALPGAGVSTTAPNIPGIGAKAAITAQGTTTGTQAANTVDQMAKLGHDAQQNIGNIDMGMAHLNAAATGGIPSGFFAPWLATASAAGKSLGVDLGSLGIDPNAVNNVQLAQKTLGVVAGNILQSTLGKDSQITDSKIQHFIHTQPDLATDPQAIQKIMQWARSQYVYSAQMSSSAMHSVDPNTGMLSPAWRPTYLAKNGFAPIYDPLAGEMRQPEGTVPTQAPPAAAPAQPPAAAPVHSRADVEAELRKRGLIK